MERYFYIKNPWWEVKNFKTGINRTLYLKEIGKSLDQSLIQILTGLRRVGKSTIALQVVKHLIQKKGINPKRILFFSIEEPSISKTPILEIINRFRAEHKIKSNTKIYVFIDEIQFRQNWEQEIKSLYDTEKIKFFLTGSSAMLLSEKLSHLTGRYLKTQVFPLTFSEYLDFKKVKVSKTDNYILKKEVENYLIDGGMPEFVLNKPDKYLETTVESILFKDLVSKFKLRNPKILTDLLFLLADRISSTASSIKISNILEINKDTTLTYINYLTKTFLISELVNFSTSRNKEIYNPSKIYFEDLGIANRYASKINFGALMENAVFNHLKIQTLNCLRTKLGYYYEDKNEVDFVVSTKDRKFLIEAKFTNEIETKNIEKAIKKINPEKTIYVTKSLHKKDVLFGKEILFIPLCDFLREDLENL